MDQVMFQVSFRILIKQFLNQNIPIIRKETLETNL